jgi:ornithine carbamoyltransferase
LAKYSSVPVINALTAKFHPLQILADLQTIYEAFPEKATQSEGLPLPLYKGLKVAWVGDGNNILHSMLVSMPRLGIDVAYATPRGYEPEEDVVDFALQNSSKGSWGKVSRTHDAREAVHDADVIVTGMFQLVTY